VFFLSNKDLLVVPNIEKELIELPQTVGVWQGDSMAPVLFLFLMPAFAETLEAKWKNSEIGVCMVWLIVVQNLMSREGKLRSQLTKEYLLRGLTAVKILQCLYDDDGAFIFASRANMTQGLALIYCHFGHLGHEMHIDWGDTPSEMECVFFPSPGFFDLQMPALLDQECGGDIDNAIGYGDNHLPMMNAKTNKKQDRATNKMNSSTMHSRKLSPLQLWMDLLPSVDTSSTLDPLFT
jgi:hypothetical protein